jgi:hypothetical protein
VEERRRAPRQASDELGRIAGAQGDPVEVALAKPNGLLAEQVDCRDDEEPASAVDALVDARRLGRPDGSTPLRCYDTMLT